MEFWDQFWRLFDDSNGSTLKRWSPQKIHQKTWTTSGRQEKVIRLDLKGANHYDSWKCNENAMETARVIIYITKFLVAELMLTCYTKTWNSVHFPKQHINCMGRYAFRKSVQSGQNIVKQHGDAIPNMLLFMCSNHDFYQWISSKQHGDAWLKKSSETSGIYQ